MTLDARVGMTSPDRHTLVEPGVSARDSEISPWVDAETARQAELDRINAEAARQRAEAMRVAAETTAMKLAAERDEAMAKASELEEALAAARDQQAEQPAADAAPAPAPVLAPAPAPAPPRLIRFAPRGHRPALTILLALASLSAAAAAVYLAYRDELTSGPGLLASAATAVLAVTVGRMGGGGPTVTIERGIVHVTTGRTTERADLSSPTTLVELIGHPGERGRKVMLVRKTRGPLTIDDSMVDLDAFIAAARHWRPGL